MSWQKCPVCDGGGQMPNAYTSAAFIVCPTCKGHRIIHEVTGLPPEYEIQQRVGEIKEFDELAKKVFNEKQNPFI